MEFCPECESKLYYREENSTLYETCKDCGYKNECKNHVIETTVYSENGIENENHKQYIRYDNSLSRTIHIRCPNDKCESRTKPQLQEAVYFPDKITLKAVYICTVCNTRWQRS